MREPQLSIQTLRDLGAIVVVAAELAWSGTRTLVGRIRPLVRPPSDIEIRSARGSTYSGVLLIQDNDVLGGVIVCTGHGSRTEEPRNESLFTNRRRSAYLAPPPPEDPYECRLPGWAEDPRGPEEEEPWHRR